MDMRTRNRMREHSGLGHKLTVSVSNARNVSRVGQKLFECSCGWRGWLDMEGK